MCAPNEGGGDTKTGPKSVPDNENDNSDDSSYTIPSFYASRNVNESSLEDQAGTFSTIFLTYLSPLLRLGAIKVLDGDDIGVPSKCDRAHETFEQVKEQWTYQVTKNDAINKLKRSKYDKRHERATRNMTPEQKTKWEEQNPFVPRKPALATSIVSSFGPWRIALGVFFMVASSLLNFIPVLILEDMVKYFESRQLDDGSYDGFANPWVSVVGLLLVPLLSSLLQTHSQKIFIHGAIFIRTAMSTLLYEKSLNVSAAGRAVTSTGQVVNMMSNDTTQLQRFIQFFGMILTAPLQIVLSLVLIYRQVGSATFVGVGYMIFLAPINVMVFSVVGKMRRKVLKYSDLRVKMMNEILNGIRIIKFYAWEKAFKKEVGELRNKELKALTNLAYVSGIGFSVLLLSAPIIQPILVFLVYIKTSDENLTAAKAFTTVALFNIMRFPFAFLPMGILQFIQSRISLQRLTAYLQLPELVQYVLDTPPEDNEDDDSAKEVGSVTMKNASFSWTNRAAKIAPIDNSNSKKKKDRRGSSSSSSQSSSKGGSSRGSGSNEDDFPLDDVEVLRDLSFTIKAGETVAVVGTVGCGKSSFLSAILGEMEPLNESKVYIPQDEETSSNTNFISYCCQSPWVVNDTLKGNILFGRELDQERYDAVIYAAALTDDLAILPAGDMTEIGERGINLSGGQKARVSFARALYAKQTKILLLDDPLSAVDAHVGEHLFNHAIMGDVSKDSTKVLVTHHVHFLSRCDKVIVLEEGAIKHCGKFADLVAEGVDFHGAVDFENDEDADKEETSGDTEASPPGLTKKEEEGANIPKAKVAKPTEETDKKREEMKKKGKSLVTKEEREEGAVSGSLYLHYAKAGGTCTFFSFFLSQGCGRGFEVGASFWLARWATDALKAVQRGDPLTDGDTMYYVNMYAFLGMMGVACLAIRAVFMAVHRLFASRKLHDNLTSSVLRAPVSFFDVTPTGRILNRFAADTDKIDLDLTQTIGQGSSTIFSVLGALGAIIAATKGTFLVPLIPISYIYYVIQKWFRKTSTELQRITSIAGSPIFSDFSQVLSGTSTIRAYGESDRFFDKTQNSFDTFNASYYLVQITNSWLGLRLDILGGFIGAFIGGIAVATANTEFIPAGWLGLALSYSIEITGFLKFGVRMIATLEADMSSVERVMQYSTQIEAEAPDVIEDKDPKAGTWPNKGEIEIQKASMRYRDGPLVLKDMDIKVNGGEKIGVVGRTGSGKSSLMNLLFRITEVEPDGGSIHIDGIDTSEVGTDILRKSLSIIPQDPVMFSNTVRYNLDPFGTSTESELLEVLEKVQLRSFIDSLEEGLDEMVAEGGENFSQGQRQLLCIARSLLRKPNVLIMDEATASIDNATDAAIQEMIRENFTDATVLTIAHRLNTILDSDRILVLDDGVVVEFDTPQNLLLLPNGIFKGMVDKSKSTKSEE